MSKAWSEMSDRQRIDYLRDKSDRTITLIGTVESKLRYLLRTQDAKIKELAAEVSRLEKSRAA